MENKHTDDGGRTEEKTRTLRDECHDGKDDDVSGWVPAAGAPSSGGKRV